MSHVLILVLLNFSSPSIYSLSNILYSFFPHATHTCVSPMHCLSSMCEFISLFHTHGFSSSSCTLLLVFLGMRPPIIALRKATLLLYIEASPHYSRSDFCSCSSLFSLSSHSSLRLATLSLCEDNHSVGSCAR